MRLVYHHAHERVGYDRHVVSFDIKSFCWYSPIAYYRSRSRAAMKATENVTLGPAPYDEAFAQRRRQASPIDAADNRRIESS